MVILTSTSLMIRWDGKLGRSYHCHILLLSVSLLLVVADLGILLLDETSGAVWAKHIPIVLFHVGVACLTSQTWLSLKLLETLLQT